jgi:hypothetical protein
MVSSLTLNQYSYTSPAYSSGTGSNATPYVEAALFLGHSIGASKAWELEVGPVVSYSQQDWYTSNTMQVLTRDAGNALFIVGLRRGL